MAKYTSISIIPSITFLLLFSTELLGDDDLAGFDDELSGFSEEEVVTIIPKKTEKEIYKLSGDLAFKSAYGYKEHQVSGVDYSGFNQAQTSISLQLDVDISKKWKLRVSGDAFYDSIYELKDEPYRSEILDDYETQLRLTDTYIQGTISDNIDIKIGRQVVVWGKSDSIRVTDVINPLDNRLPAMTDIEDLRLSIGMIKLDYYIDEWNISAMLIPESRTSLEPTPRGEFFNVDAIFGLPTPDPFLELETPSSSLENMQSALAINGTFSGWDLSFYLAEVLDSKAHIEIQKRVYSKIKMAGIALNIAKNSWLLKSELAYLDDLHYNTTTDKKNRLDALIGFDYMGYKDRVISLELANRTIFDYEEQMKNRADFIDENEMQIALRVNDSFLNETLSTTVLVTIFGSSFNNGGFTRAWIEYDIADGISATLGLVDYIGGDKAMMESNKDNDRLFFEVSYSF